MSQLELLSLVLKVLTDLQIPYMLVGSYASSFYGEPRSTHDIDMVVDLDPAKIPLLVSSFDRQQYYLSEVALREGRMANLIELATGDKVDFFLLGKDPVSQQSFARRSKQRVLELEADIASAEDTILSKLHWSRIAGGLTRQETDVFEILRIRRNQLDMSYLILQAQRLQLAEALQEQLSRLDSLQN